MGKIHKITKNGQTIYPATTTDAVVNPSSKKSVTKELTELEAFTGYGVVYDYYFDGDIEDNTVVLGWLDFINKSFSILINDNNTNLKKISDITENTSLYACSISPKCVLYIVLNEKYKLKDQYTANITLNADQIIVKSKISYLADKFNPIKSIYIIDENYSNKLKNGELYINYYDNNGFTIAHYNYKDGDEYLISNYNIFDDFSIVKKNTGEIVGYLKGNPLSNRAGSLKLPIKSSISKDVYNSISYILNPNVPAGYVLNKLSPVKTQVSTTISTDGIFLLDRQRRLNFYKVGKGKKYFLNGSFSITQNAAAWGSFDDLLFNGGENLKLQDANSFKRYSEIIISTKEYLYVDYGIDVYELQEILPSVEDGGNPIVTIAASNSTSYAKSLAKYVCAGTSDDIVINKAISELDPEGGEIHLCAGLYNISSPIIIDRRIKIVGEGTSIGGIPEYEPTNGNTYTDNVFGLNMQNLYGNNGGSTLLRASADCNVIQIGKDVSQKIQIVLRDFCIQGYGKDRHTKCGIYGKSSTDISLIDNISITECYIGCYLHGNSENSYNDAIKITNSSFQWCACGLVVYSSWGVFTNNCIADNNGIASYTDEDSNTTELYTGGCYFGGFGSVITNNIIVRTSSYKIDESNPGDALVLKAQKSIISNNQIAQVAGNAIRLEKSDFVTIQSNTIEEFGIAQIAGKRNAIISNGWSNLIKIIGNNIVNNNRNNTVDKAIVIKSGDSIIIANNGIMNFGRDRYEDTIIETHTKKIINNNMIFGYDEEGTYNNLNL